MDNLKIDYVSVDEIKPYEHNARKHGEEDVEAIKKSIEKWGFNDPIGIWHDTIVEGHGRLLAAKELGMEQVPVIRLEHLDDEGRRAYALAHNKTAELSEWDFATLDEELADLDIDMSEFGFIDSAQDGYIDTFFEEGVQEKEINKIYKIIITFNTERERDDQLEILQEQGYSVAKA